MVGTDEAAGGESPRPERPLIGVRGLPIRDEADEEESDEAPPPADSAALALLMEEEEGPIGLWFCTRGGDAAGDADGVSTAGAPLPLLLLLSPAALVDEAAAAAAAVTESGDVAPPLVCCAVTAGRPDRGEDDAEEDPPPSEAEAAEMARGLSPSPLRPSKLGSERPRCSVLMRSAGHCTLGISISTASRATLPAASPRTIVHDGPCAAHVTGARVFPDQSSFDSFTGTLPLLLCEWCAFWALLFFRSLFSKIACAAPPFSKKTTSTSN